MDLSSEEVVLWRKYKAKVGFLSDQLEYSAGLICSTIANFAGKISTRDVRAIDFMPSMQDRENEPDEVLLAHKLMMSFAAVNRSVKSRKPK